MFLSDGELYNEVDRCLYCQEKPCAKACPSGCSPADFIMAIRTREKSDFKTSAKIIMGSNPLGGVCGAVCPDWFCMDACSRKLLDKPINIPAVQATIIQKAKDLNLMPHFEPLTPNGKKVAIIGCGASGLGAAATLAPLGYSIDIYESSKEAGGSINIIPEERLDKKILKTDIEFIKNLGDIKFYFSSEIKNPKKLLSSYDAVIVSTGVDKQLQLGIPNEDFAIKGIEYLKNQKKYNLKNKTVLISGGGAVACDCAITALKNGAKSVEIFTRKNSSEIQIPEKEIKELFNKKININGRMKIKEIIVKNRKVCGAVFVKLDKEGNEIKNSQQLRPDADFIILAIKNVNSIKIEKEKGLFYCGDVLNGASTVVECVASGKNAAISVDAYLKGEKVNIKDNKKNNTVLASRNMKPIDLETDFFGYKMKSPFMISASPHSDGFDQVKKAYENGWPGVIMKTAFDNVDIHIPSEYMFLFNKSTYGNCDNVSDHPLDRVCKEIEKIKKLYPDRITGASTGGPVTGNEERDKSVWQSNTKKLEDCGAMVIEYSLSCPQGGDGTKGDIVSQNPELSAKIVDWIMEISNPEIPKLFKLTGAVTSIYQIVKAIKDVLDKYPHKKAGITLANSFPALGWHKRKEGKWDEGVVIGLSGAGIAPISYLTVAKAVKIGIPISANGGAMDYKSAAHFLAMGAKNVQFCTILMKYGYDIINHLEWGLSSLLEYKGYKSVEEFIGCALPEIITPFEKLNSIKMIPDVDKEKCIHCGNCTTCGYLAVKLNSEKIPEFDSKRCVGCSICSKKCPSQAIFMRKRKKGEIVKK
ncbi:MAG: FAD-dependent oxidoreductase [Elusimicrobiota bacterium]